MDAIAEAIALRLGFSHSFEFQRGCIEKIGYEDFSAAKRASRRQHRLRHKQYSVYRCAFCNLFHIGGRRRDLEASQES